MITSMTGYGAASEDVDGMSVSVEIWSVNSRFFDLSARLSPGLEKLEEQIRREVKERCRRGRVTVAVTVDSRGGERDGRLEFDKERLDRYMSLMKTLEEQYAVTVSISDLVDLKELIADPGAVEIDEKLVLELLREAVEELESMRSAEGETMDGEFRHGIDRLTRLLEEVRSLWEAAFPKVPDVYRRRIGQLLEGNDVEVDETRVVQEAAVIAEKLDITEECVRCASHLEQFKAFLDEEKPVGKRMKFLLQEVLREVNTIGSKTNDVQITRHIVQMKDEVEKLREQVQNVL